MKTVKTPKGTDLPLINLKGKDYLMVGHRMVWFNEVEKNFEIETEFLLLTDEQTIVKARVNVFNDQGIKVKSATATKRETKKDFSDHTEKAETSAIGRALAMLGYGTQFAIADLDEGDRLADSPVINTNQNATIRTITQVPSSVTPNSATTIVVEQTEAPKTSYRKPTKRATAPNEVVNNGGADDGWN